TGRDYQVEISDQAPGAPEEWLSRLGEPFARVPGQLASSGHGLALAIARRAVARHGGTLDFHLTDYGVQRARISLPCHAQSSDERWKKSRESSSGTGLGSPRG